MKMISNIIILVLFLYFAIGIYLYIKQKNFLYFPTKAVVHGHETIQFHNDGESINVIVLNPGQQKALLYFGGNAETVAWGAAVFEEKLPKYTTYMLEYRGYGESSGEPSEEGLFSDALYVFDHIKQKHDSISLFGRSLGTGLASFVAAKRDVDKMVLITPFDSIENLAQKRFPIYPMSLLLKDKYDSISYVPDIKADTIVLIASEDTVIPTKHAYALVKDFPETQIKTVTIEGSGHNDIAYTKEYHKALEEFLK